LHLFLISLKIISQNSFKNQDLPNQGLKQQRTIKIWEEQFKETIQT
jgi:hypothetical protein